MIESSGAKYVWYPERRCGFAIGRIVDIGQTNVTVQPIAWPSASSLDYKTESEHNNNSNNNSGMYNVNVNNSNSKQLEATTTLEFPYKLVYPCDQFDASKLTHYQTSAAANHNNYANPNTNRAVRLPASLMGYDVDDSCALIQLNEAALLENVRVRFHRDKIYTYVAHILIAVNPYFEVKGLHSAEAISRYQGKSLGTMPPHVYAIADKAYRDMKAFKQSQSIIISGESGAGKTESQKYVLRYLCLSGTQSGRLEKLILDGGASGLSLTYSNRNDYLYTNTRKLSTTANPILEAFGNAKTIRNNNSSRFGKFIEVHYSSQFQVTGGLFFHYLLEKSRICTQSAGERNYHIFYQLCACLPDDQWRQLELGSPDKFRYLNGGCTQYFISQSLANNSLASERVSQSHRQLGPIQDQLIDDFRCYEQTDKALTNFGLSPQQKHAIYSIVVACLHLGNVNFCDDPDDNRGGCRLEARTEPYLNSTARLIGLEADLLRQALVSRIMSTARGGHKGTVYMVQLSAQQAQAARDALAKAIYSKLFDYIVTKIVNKSIPFASSSYYIGVLDVAGFEYFQHNSFEQFLINFCNEKLQQFFNERILKEEQLIYDKEGLQLERVEFVDNQDCIQLFELKSQGIFDLLDEESRLPKPSAQHFTQSVHAQNGAHFRLALPRASKLKVHRGIRDDEGFVIRHFAGAVCYETHSFIDKNNDALHASLKSLMLEADNELLRELFQADHSLQAQTATTTGRSQFCPSAPGSTANFQFSSSNGNGNSAISASTGNKLNFVSVGTTFRSQLGELMHKLHTTGSHFVRCIKPNSEMVAHKFEGSQILSQLHCSGMDSVLKLMQQGYPSRLSFNDLYQAYKSYLPPELARLDSHLFCRALFKAIGLNDRDFRFGSSKVFFRPAKFAEFDQIVKTSDSEHMARLVAQVSRWLIRSRWRKVQYCGLSVVKLRNKILYRREQIIRLQTCWRAAVVQRKLQFRLKAIKAAQQIEANLREFEQITRQQLSDTAERANLKRESQLLRQEVSQFAQSMRQSVQAIIVQLQGGAHRQAPQVQLNTGTTKVGARQQPDDSKEACEKHLDLLRTKRDLLIRSIRDKIAKQKELAALERQLSEERARRESQEIARRREEQLKQQRNELELRRQAEAQLAISTNTTTKQLVDSATDPISLHYQHQLTSTSTAASKHEHEQEQRDYEIAMRLAQERGDDSGLSSGNGGGLVGRGVLPPSENLANVPNLKSGLNLIKWKYSDLRDTINTSCDLELLEACKREFHRRLKVYHAWRAMNSAQKMPHSQEGGQHGARDQSNPLMERQMRAPSCIMNQSAGACDELTLDDGRDGAGGARVAEQRYFRIPFLKQSSSTANASTIAGSQQQRGWWFAHFDGQWIARQLELHPNREPILLVAGQHDIDMCELSLGETRLTSKRGAEILAQEFEAEWKKHGGQPYTRRRAANS